jgi:hypothetical protein
VDRFEDRVVANVRPSVFDLNLRLFFDNVPNKPLKGKAAGLRRIARQLGVGVGTVLRVTGEGAAV